MKKELAIKKFLDFIYGQRALVLADLDRLAANCNRDKVFCDHCKSECDENMAELRTRRSQLSSIDDTIEAYLRIHTAIIQ